MTTHHTISYGALLAVTCLLAASSILYELIIAESVATVAINRIVWYSVVIGVFIGSLGIGALTTHTNRSRADALRLLVRTEIALAIVGSLAASTIFFAHSVHIYFLVQDSAWLAYTIFPLTALALVGTIGYLSGRELPLIIVLARHMRLRAQETALSRVLGADYIGSLIGTLLFALILIPHVDLIAIGAMTALVNLGSVGLLLALHRDERPIRLPGTLLVATITLLVAVIAVRSEALDMHFAGRYYFYEQYARSASDLFSVQSTRGTVSRYRSPYQVIDLVDDPAQHRGSALVEAYSDRNLTDIPLHTTLYLNGDFQFATEIEDIYHEWFAHVPLMLSSTIPEHVLVLGAGDGLLIRELLKHDAIQTITHVELDPVMDQLARTHPTLVRLNGRSLDDERVITHIDDAYRYLLTVSERYDAIFIDFPYPNDYNLSRLYSKEFYALAKKRLAPGGFMVMDAAGIEPFEVPTAEGPISYVGRDWFVYYHTLGAAGFDELTVYRSRLEDDNPEALAAIAREFASFAEVLAVQDGSSAYTTAEDYYASLLRGYVETFTQGFIIAHTSERPPFRYRDLGIDVSVLNEARFDLSYLDYDNTSGVEGIPPNSIMRPTFTDMAFWRLRYPY